MNARIGIVQHIYEHPGTGDPLKNQRVSIRLASPGFVNDGSTEKIRSHYATTDDTGMWSAPLEFNADIDPAGTHYTVKAVGKADLPMWSFVVDSEGPTWLRDCLVEDPSNPAPVVAGVRTVNGEGPDADGNVTVSGGGGVSNVGLDPDGVPYFEVGASATNLATDTDGVPYFEAA